MTAQEHPAVEAWSPEPPPPPQRRAGPGLLAGLMALLLVFGMVGLVAARQAGGARTGASSPEGAAGGLLAALDRDTLDARALDRAARYLTGEERLLVTTYGDRMAALAAARGGQGELGVMSFAVRNVRFQWVDGSDGVAVLEVVSGIVRVRASGGGHLEMSVDQARQRLAEQTGSRVPSLRVVTVRSGGRWYVALLPTALEWSRLATAGGTADYARLTAAAAPGASSPEAAVRLLLTTLDRPLAESAARLAPGERNAVDAYQPALRDLLNGFTADLGFGLGATGRGAGRVVTGTERVADGVVRVRLDGGPSPQVIALQRGGTWYPSMVFTLTEVTLTSSEREHS